jgi:hypothetical protein
MRSKQPDENMDDPESHLRRRREEEEEEEAWRRGGWRLPWG